MRRTTSRILVGRSRAARPRGLAARRRPPLNPSIEGSRCDDRDQLPESRADLAAKADEAAAFGWRHHDPLGQPTPEHLVLGLEELDLRDELVVAGHSQRLEQGVEESGHPAMVRAYGRCWADDTVSEQRHALRKAGLRPPNVARVLTRSLEWFQFGKSNPVVNPKRERATLG